MTTNITVTTHDWPVQITAIDKDETGYETKSDLGRFEPQTQQTISIHSRRALRFDELPVPEAVVVE